MKHLATLFLIGLMQAMAYAQAPVFDWVKATQGTYRSWARSVLVDPFGNLVITGAFDGTVDFDPGPSAFNLTSNNKFDCYVLKLDSNGNFLWAKSFGGIGNDATSWAEVDRNGNVYVVGEFRDTVDFDPGTGVYKLHSTLNNWDDGFLVKLDANGNFQWANKMGGPPGDYYQSIEVDVFENVYLTGFFYGPADFDPGAGVYNINSKGNGDIFIQKLDKNGNFKWAKGFGGKEKDIGFSILTDDLGFVYLTGIYGDTVDFDPGSGTSNLVSAGKQNSFVQKLDSNGNFIWAKSFGGNTTLSVSLAIDPNQNLLLTGHYFTGGDFDPGPGVFNLAPIGVINSFVLKLDNSGNFHWANSAFAVGQSIQSDSLGNVYVLGDFSDTCDFDPDTSTFNLISNGVRDVFIQKLDSSGKLTWALSFGADKYEGAASLFLDRKLNIYSCGIFYSSTVDFDPGPRVYNLTNPSQQEAFIHKISQCKTIETDSITACDSIKWTDGNTYYSSNNNAKVVLTNSVGCDSVIELSLELNKSSLVIDNQQSCTPYTWIDGITYSASNDTAKYRLTNSVGCDSIITLNFIRNYASTVTDTQKACNSYSWIDGNTYTEDNHSAKYTLINSQGCDSVITLDLKINKLDNGVTFQSDSVLTAHSFNASYQWLKCDQNFEPIPSEIKQVMIANTNGQYAVEVAKNGCKDTSNCISVTTFVPPVYPAFTCRSIYPNPSQGELSIVLGELKNTRIQLYSIEGKIIGPEDNISGPIYQLNLELPSATYILKVETEAGTHRCRIEVN